MNFFGETNGIEQENEACHGFDGKTAGLWPLPATVGAAPIISLRPRPELPPRKSVDASIDRALVAQRSVLDREALGLRAPPRQRANARGDGEGSEDALGDGE